MEVCNNDKPLSLPGLINQVAMQSIGEPETSKLPNVEKPTVR